MFELLLKKFCSQDLSKMGQSGHTDDDDYAILFHASPFESLSRSHLVSPFLSKPSV